MIEWIGDNAIFLFVVMVLAIFVIILGTNIISRRKNMDQFGDARKNIEPNNTNYNMATFERDDLESMSNMELQILLQKWEEGRAASLSPKDFQYIKKRLDDN